jgi:glycosyltransferase involved in cell wall biosynthesis
MKTTSPTARRLRVLQLGCQAPFPPDQGGKIRSLHLLERLREVADVSFVCFQREPAEQAAADALAARGLVITPVPVPSFAPRWWHHLRSRHPLLVQRYGATTLLEAASLHLTRARYDLVIVDGPDALLATVGIERTPGVAVVYQAHNVESEVYRRCLAVDGRSLKSRLVAGFDLLKMQRFERQRVRQFPGIIAVSARDAATLGRWAPGASLHVVPNGADCARLLPLDVAPEPGAIVFMGTLSYAPNRDAVEYFAAEILPRVRRAVPAATLRIVGRQDEALTRALRPVPGVHFTGYVDDVRPHLARAQVVVVPLRAGGGTRLKILEALAMGRPVVSTTVGAEGLDLTSGEHLLVADHPEAFAAAVIRLLQDTATAATLAAHGRRAVLERYDWRAITSRYVDAIQQIHADHRSGVRADALAS